jgi:hypothetical protein
MPSDSYRILLSAAFAIGFFSFANSLPAQDNASAAAIAETLHRMTEIKVEDELGYTVPGGDIPLLTQVKHQLRDLFAQALVESGPGVDAKTAKARFLQLLRDAGVEVPGAASPSESPYGRILDVRVEQRPDLQDVILFSPRLSIACGDDSPLYAFEKAGGQWHLAIAVEANGYQEVKGAMGELQFQLSPPDPRGTWFLVYLHDSPWCTSAWNRIDYAVVQPGIEPYSPRQIIQASQGYYQGDDYDPRLQVRANGFRIDFEGSQLLAPDLLIRYHTVNYKLVGGHAIRIPPVAHSPAGFLDEWAQADLTQAARWALQLGANVGRWHSAIHDPKHDWELAFVQPCPGGRKWQLGVNSDRQRVFATVVLTPAGYRLADIGDSRQPGCPGEQAPTAEPATAAK